MKHDQVVAAHAQLLDRDSRLSGVSYRSEISATTLRRPSCSAIFASGAWKLAGAAGLEPVERVQHLVEMFQRGGMRSTMSSVEGDQADAIALALRQVGQARGQHLAVVELGDRAAAVIHRAGHVEQQVQVGVGVGLEFLDVEPVGAREQAPVDAAHVVAGHVGAVLGEIDRHAEHRRAVQAADEAVDHAARDQFEVVDPGQHRRIDEAFTRYLARDFSLLSTSAPYIPEPGSGTVSSRRSISASVVTFSDSAWKLRNTRWRSTGPASARMSSKSTW